MSNHHNPAYVPSDYTPPVVSPTGSIAFSDAAIMEGGQYDQQFGVYQEAYAAQRGWYNPNPNEPYQSMEPHPQIQTHAAASYTMGNGVPASGPYNASGHHLNWTPADVGILQPPHSWAHSAQHQSPLSPGAAAHQTQQVVDHRPPAHPQSINHHQQTLTAPILSPPTAPHPLSLHPRHPPPSSTHPTPTRHNSIASTILSASSSAHEDTDLYYRGPSGPASPTDRLRSPLPAHPSNHSHRHSRTASSAASPPSSTATATTTAASAPPKRKRGRPRLPRDDAPLDVRRARASKRQPHNQVERKYREGLNADLERLRLAIPRLAQAAGGAGTGAEESGDGDGEEGAAAAAGAGAGAGMGQRPSKAQVLQAAVRDLEEMRDEAERLRRRNRSLERERDRWRDKALGQGGRVGTS